jgi:hypothetical protein
MMKILHILLYTCFGLVLGLAGLSINDPNAWLLVALLSAVDISSFTMGLERGFER